jgi:hypothetical protein
VGSGGGGGDTSTGGTGGAGATGASEPAVAFTFDELRVFLDTPIANGSACFDCHESEGDLPYVFKDDETLYDTLMTSVIERCDGRVLVVPGEPENSALYLVMSGVDQCGMLNRMPKGCVQDEFFDNCVPPATVERIRLWIAEGAQR